jgi:ribosomal protein L6P/L9E
MFTNHQNILYPKKTIQYAYSQIILFGFNYSFKRLRNRKILLNLQYSYNSRLRIPSTLVARIYKRRLVLYGEKLQLLSFIKELVELRNPNIYTGKGIRLRTLPYRRKPGKVNKR